VGLRSKESTASFGPLLRRCAAFLKRAPFNLRAKQKRSNSNEPLESTAFFEAGRSGFARPLSPLTFEFHCSYGPLFLANLRQI
jgi:hypothetical protein